MCQASAKPDVIGSLIVPSRGSALAMPGSVLNELNGFPIEASVIPRMVGFLRTLYPVGASDPSNAPMVYDIFTFLSIGQLLDTDGQRPMREAIRRWVEPGPP